MLCWFQMYSKVTWSYKYMYLFFFKLFSHLDYYIVLIRAPCERQSKLVIAMSVQSRNKDRDESGKEDLITWRKYLFSSK